MLFANDRNEPEGMVGEIFKKIFNIFLNFFHRAPLPATTAV
jgi:hypothetical protein